MPIHVTLLSSRPLSDSRPPQSSTSNIQQQSIFSSSKTVASVGSEAVQVALWLHIGQHGLRASTNPRQEAEGMRQVDKEASLNQTSLFL